MSYRLRIQENAGNFTKTDEKIARYFLKHPQEAVFLSVGELGAATKTSPTAIMRFVKKINYEGLNELRIAIAHGEKDIQPESTLIVKKTDSVSAVKSTMVNLICDSAGTTGALNPDGVLEKAIKMIQKADTLYLFGVGASGIVAEDLYHKLVRINKRCMFDVKSNVQTMYSVHGTKKDAYIAFSYSGESREVNAAVAECKASGVPGIAVSGAVASTLSKLADVWIKLPSMEKDLRIGAIQSRYASLMISDILFLGIAQANYEEMEENLKRTRRIVKQLNK
ncbi:MAG: MurR/RpiR family transcriptional regulator [Ruminococcaceae bacterium]|nr:MurR/RpiR family transcriptional regulator [Oscillospiraceae bacterium]